MLSIPSQPEDITPGWLTDALHEGGYLLNGHVERATLDILDPTKAANGTVVKLHLEYSTNSPELLPPTMVAKLPSLNPASAQRLRSIGGDRVEVFFYQQLRESAGLRTPKCFLSVLDETTGRFVILLEDLSAYRFARDAEGLTDNEIVAVVKALAVSQAAWWEHPTLPALEWLGSFPAPTDPQHSAFRVAWPVVVDRLAGGSPEIGALGEQIDLMMRQAHERLAWPPLTLTNTDVRQENLFFAGDAENPLPIFIDWQFLLRGRGPASLASFLAFLPQRDRLEESLVRLYYSELERGGVRDYSVQECLRDYWMGIIRRFSYPTTALATVSPDSPQGTALLNALSRFGMDSLERYLSLLSEG